MSKVIAVVAWSSISETILGLTFLPNEQRDAGREQGGWELEIVERDKEAKGFEVLPKRWIVERTFG